MGCLGWVSPGAIAWVSVEISVVKSFGVNCDFFSSGALAPKKSFSLLPVQGDLLGEAQARSGASVPLRRQPKIG